MFTTFRPNCQKKYQILTRDIKPYSFEPLTKTFTDSINCKELAAASAYVEPEQPPVPPTLGPQEELDWCVFVFAGISLIDKSTHWS